MVPNSFKKYENAQKQVKRIKSFYRHIIVYIIIMGILFITRYVIFPKIGFHFEEPGFKNWLDWNTYGMGVAWLFAILIQAVFVFKPIKVKNWEERKIKELMDKEEQFPNDLWK